MIYFLIFWMIIGWLLRLLPERRTLWFGAVAFVWLGVFYGTGLFSIYWLGNFAQYTIAQIILMTLLAIPGVLLLSFPVWLVLLLIYNGIVLIRREGFNWRNCLSLGLAVASIAYTFLHPMLSNFLALPVIDLLDGWFLIAINLVTVELIMYVLTTVANSIHLKNYRLNAIIVLGAGLMGEEVTPLLACRIDRGIALWKKQKQESYLVMSGGQGDDEVISEAEAMKRYAMKKGIDEKWILMENQSTNTEENIRYSYQILTEHQIDTTKGIAIVTNYFHIFRAVVLARTLGYRCIGYGARTRLYYSMNAILRDFVGYFVLTWRKQVTIYSFFAILHLLFWAAQWYSRLNG